MRPVSFVATLLAGTSLALPALARPPHAHHSDAKSYGYLIPAFGMSMVSNKAAGTTGAGVELAYTYYPHADTVGVGAYSQADVFVSDESSHFAGGFRLGKAAGWDLGYAYRGQRRGLVGYSALETGLFLGLGSHLTLGGRVSIPVTNVARKNFGVESAFTLTLRVPALIHGPDPTPGPGRPAFYWMGGG
jgi:hypothetical protein